MEIRLQETLRTLRRDKNITQEELANFLGISAQAVSKWERGEGMPDITLLPRLSRYFNVSVDTLLGMEDVRVDELVEECEKEDHRLGNLGQTEERLALWEKMYADYPNHHRVLHGLMYALFSQNVIENADRIIDIAKALLDHPKADSMLRAAAIQLLTYTYNNKGDTATAKKYAEMATSSFACREILLSSVLEGEEGCLHDQKFLLDLIDNTHLCAHGIVTLGDYPPEKSIRVWKSMIRIFEAVFEDGDYGFFACRMRVFYSCLAKDYAKLGDKENCLAAIEKSADFAIMYDTAPAFHHTSPLIDRYDYDPHRSAKNYSHNDSYERLKTLKHKLYDLVRDDARFQEIVEKLNAVAQ